MSHSWEVGRPGWSSGQLPQECKQALNLLALSSRLLSCLCPWKSTEAGLSPKLQMGTHTEAQEGVW